MYNEFSTANIQIDKDFSAKLSGYGCVGQIPTPETEIPNNSVVSSWFLYSQWNFNFDLPHAVEFLVFLVVHAILAS